MSPAISCQMPENLGGGQGASSAMLAPSDLRQKHLGIWAPSQLDQFGAEVLLQRAPRARSAGGKDVAGVVRHVADGNSWHACILL